MVPWVLSRLHISLKKSRFSEPMGFCGGVALGVRQWPQTTWKSILDSLCLARLTMEIDQTSENNQLFEFIIEPQPQFASLWLMHRKWTPAKFILRLGRPFIERYDPTLRSSMSCFGCIASYIGHTSLSALFFTLCLVIKMNFLLTSRPPQNHTALISV